MPEEVLHYMSIAWGLLVSGSTYVLACLCLALDREVMFKLKRLSQQFIEGVTSDH